MKFSDFLKEAAWDELQPQRQAKRGQAQNPQFAEPETDNLDDFIAGLKGHVDSPIAKQEQPNREKQKTAQPKNLKTASAETTRQRVGSMQMTPDMAAKFAAMNLGDEEDIISDEEAARNAGLSMDQEYSEPKPPEQPSTDLAVVTPTTIPAILTKGMANTTDLIPDWHQVKHLPGYLSKGIRQIGRAVFAPFTSTPIEEIQVLASLGGQGPNTDNEINAVLGYVTKNGERHTEAEIQFHEKIPDYQADVQVYMADGITFFIVKDFAGKYVYSWPTKDGDGLQWPTQAARLSNDRPRLGRD